MWNLIDTICKYPRYSLRFIKYLYPFFKKVFGIIFIVLVIYYGAKLYTYNRNVIRPALVVYENKESLNVNAIFAVADLMKQVVIKCKNNVTISWGVLISKNINNYEKELSFPLVVGTGFCNSYNKKLCVFDRKKDNPAFWDAVYTLSDKDGKFIENDEIRLILEHVEKPLSFKELEPILIPIYNEMGLSMEMRSLQYKSPDLYKVLVQNPVTLNSMQKIAVSKVRNNTVKNKFVVFLIFATQWGNSENGCTDEGLKQATFVIADRIKKTMIMF